MMSQGAIKNVSPVVWIPEDLQTALQLKQKYGSDGQFIAAGTLLQTYWEKGQPVPSHLISLEKIKELQGFVNEIADGKSMVQIGALTTLSQLLQHPSLLSHLPLLVEAVKSIAAPAVRNRGTIGGNIAGSTGDTLPAFLVLDTVIAYTKGSEILRKSLWDCLQEGIFLKDSLLVSISVCGNGNDKETSSFFKKVGRREAFTPSVVTIAGCCRLNDQKEVESIRLAVGGASVRPQRLEACEQLLIGKTISKEQLTKLQRAIQEEFNAPSDDFFSERYKKTIAANLLVYEMARVSE
ncbi:FAD binding domain-containing protein [Neobacillus sp. Marseille-QA0830]